MFELSNLFKGGKKALVNPGESMHIDLIHKLDGKQIIKVAKGLEKHSQVRYPNGTIVETISRKVRK